MTKKTSDLEELFGGLYYEEGGYFHPVGNHPKFIERAEKVLAKEKMELVEKIKEVEPDMGKIEKGEIDLYSLGVGYKMAKDDVLLAFKKEIGGSDTNAVTKEEVGE